MPEVATGPAGNRIAYEVSGSGPDVVLVHGITESSAAWGPIPAVLAESARVVTMDLRGHGASDATETYGLDELAADVAAVVDEVGLAEPTMVGHSLGGFVVSVYAARRPVAAVVNVDQPLALAAFKDQLGQVEPMLRGEAFPGVIAMMFDGFMAELPDAERDRLGELRRPDQAAVLGIWEPVFTSTVDELDALVRDLVEGIDAPYLAIHGAEPGDEYRAWLAGVIPHAELEVWPGAHYPHLLDPERFAGRVRTVIEADR